MLSSASKHALVLLQYLVKVGDGGFYTVQRIAAETKAPAPYLSKLVKELVSLNILESKRGVGGGVRLTEKARCLSLYGLCEAMKDPVIKQECVLRSSPCNPDAPCAFHKKYGETRSHLIEFLLQTKVASYG